MKVNVNGLINRLNDLRERILYLLDKLENFEEIEIEDVEQCFQYDDPLNLSIALDLLEQAEKLDNIVEIIREKEIDIKDLKFSASFKDYNDFHLKRNHINEEQFNLLKETIE